MMHPATTIHVHTGVPYDVRIFEKEGDARDACTQVTAEIGALLAPAGDAVSAEENARNSSRPRLMVVTDETVNALYGDTMMAALNEAGWRAEKFVCPAGEQAKSLRVLEQALERLAEQAYTRGDVLIAFGGGVVGDLTGFLAATYLRGVRYVQVPTTLLAMVDSSVGGKTAVNLAAGKNLAGAFHQPSLVVVCEAFLDSLPEEVLLDGLAEAIKCGCIGDAELLHFLRDDVASAASSGQVKESVLGPGALTRTIAAAIELKRRLVEDDEKDTGARQLLNFGHTLGHAIEGASDYAVSHGHAVASGMYLCAKGAYLLGWSKEDLSEELGALLTALGYTLVYPYKGDLLYEYALRDKKRGTDTLTLVVPETLGHCILRRLPLSQLRLFIAASLS